MEMQELIRVEQAPAALSVNFDELRDALAERLSDFDIVVSEDGVKDAKKLATEVNKLAGDIDQRRKDAIAEVSEPINAFDRQMKELVSMCKAGRQKILDQVSAYEEKRLATCRELLEQFAADKWFAASVEPEHRRANFDDLVKISSLTETDNLTAKAIAIAGERLSADKERQQTVRLRLAELEATCYREGLSAPLTAEHVSRFLEADDETYAAELSRLIAAEIERERVAEQRRAQQAEREAAAKPRDEAAPEARPEAPTAPTQPAKPGKQAVRVAAYFDLQVGPNTSDAEIEAECRRTFERVGIKTLAVVEVHRSTKARGTT